MKPTLVSPSLEWSEHSLPEQWGRVPHKWMSGLKRETTGKGPCAQTAPLRVQHPLGLVPHEDQRGPFGTRPAGRSRSQEHTRREGLSITPGSEAGPRGTTIQNAPHADKTATGSLQSEGQKWLSHSGCFCKSPRPRIPKLWSRARQTAARAFWVSKKENEEDMGFSATAWERRV